MNASAQHEPTAASRANGDAPVSTTPILAVNFVATLGFSIVLPFLVYLVTRFGGNAFVYGVMGATYSLFQLIGAPILGRWSDRIGRKRVLFLSQLGTALSWGIFLVALALPATPLVHARSGLLGTFTVTVPLAALFFARALDGVTGGNASVANAYLADITPERDRTANFGRLAVSANLGFIVGPALAGLLGATAWREAAPVTAALLISIAACVLIVVGLRESAPCARARIPERPPAPRFFGQESRDCFHGTPAGRTPLRAIARMALVPRLLVLDFLVFLSFNIFYVVFPIYVVRDLRWPLAATGIFFGVLSLLMVLVQGPVLAWAGRHWSERTLVLAGSVILAASFPFFGASRAPVLYAGAAILALGNGLMWPSLLALLSRAAGTERQGAVQGLAGSASALASITGLLLGGILFGLLGAHTFLFATATSLLVAIVGFGMEPATAQAT